MTYKDKASSAAKGPSRRAPQGHNHTPGELNFTIFFRLLAAGPNRLWLFLATRLSLAHFASQLPSATSRCFGRLAAAASGKKKKWKKSLGFMNCRDSFHFWDSSFITWS